MDSEKIDEIEQFSWDEGYKIGVGKTLDDELEFLVGLKWSVGVKGKEDETSQKIILDRIKELNMLRDKHDKK